MSLLLEEKIDIHDEYNIKFYKEAKEKNYLKGTLIFRDPLTGKIVDIQNNLILLRGRAYILELLFDLIASTDNNYVNDKNRTVCLFKIGQGGSDIYSTPFENIAPKFINEDLYQPVPFKIVDGNADIDSEKVANPTFTTELTDEEKYMYYLPKNFPDATTRYYGKIFEKDTKRLKINKATGECYVQLTLRITPIEARGFIINELGLVLARYDEDRNIYNNAELFSHVTFDPYVLKSLRRGVIIEYLVYA